MAVHQLRLPTDEGPGVDHAARVERIPLDATSWIELGRDWMRDADALFGVLDDPAVLSWERRRRPMYGRLVDEPRLTAEHCVGPTSHPVVREVSDALSSRYDRPLVHLWANWYRDGDDAVAWHADRIGRVLAHPVVTIVSIGGPRDFLLRPRPGTGPPGRPSRSLRFTLHSGDLLVMGGECQRRWEHAVPRRRNGAPRISLTFRERAQSLG